jgi:hypothetical protein
VNCRDKDIFDRWYVVLSPKITRLCIAEQLLERWLETAPTSALADETRLCLSLAMASPTERAEIVERLRSGAGNRSELPGLGTGLHHGYEAMTDGN